MPRIARFVCQGVPHHVTQRGNRRGRVFFSDADCRIYLSWLREYATRHGLDILAYCLMTNHVHLVVVPVATDSMELTFRHLHTRYAQRVNRANDWKGHVWQGRYFASALDEPHLWSAIRYVERNPVRAQLVARAEDYPWSSASARCGSRQDPVLCGKANWVDPFKGIGDWSAWLAAGDEPNSLALLRKHAPKGLPCGSEEFLRTLELSTGRRLDYRGRRRSG